MKTPNILTTSQRANLVEIKQRINSFKHHLVNLQKISTKYPTIKTNSKLTSNPQCPNIYAKNYPWQVKQNSQPKGLNKYQKQKLNTLSHENNKLLAKLIKIDDSHSQYYGATLPQKLQIARNNFLVTKYGERKRSLTQINNENQRISLNLFRCKSSYKLNQIKTHSFNYTINAKDERRLASKKSKNHFLDYRVLAKQQMKKKSPLKLRHHLLSEKKIV